MAFPVFTLFSNLPAELRLKVWHHAISDAVYVKFSADKEMEDGQQYILSRCSDHAVPPLLHVNSEARAVALEYYHLLGVGPSRAYFNPVLDTVMLSALFCGAVDFHKAVRDPCGLLGPNVSLVHHIAYHQQWEMGWAMDHKFLLVFGEGVETFTFLDLGEWEEAFYPFFEEVREAMNARTLRKEDLVLRNDEDVASFPWCNMAKQMLQGNGGSGRDIQLAVVRLNMPPAIKEEKRLEKEEEKRKRKEEEERKRKGGYWGYLTRYLVSAGVLDPLRIPYESQYLVREEEEDRRMRGGPWNYLTRVMVRAGAVDPLRIPSETRGLVGK